MTSATQMVGASPPMLALERAIESAAGSSAKVLLTGETGVGKEVVAGAIHRRSERRARPFVTLNCAGIPESLLESEFFGHAKGSFTDAHRDNPGLLRQADTGTVFLDEVGEMSLRMQVLLLRFLETGEIETVGQTGRSRVDVRVIAATNRDLVADVAAGTFRQDLYYRLNVLHVAIPPLRERGSDIELLMCHFLEALASEYQVPKPELSPAALAVSLQYAWPGNVRELRNVAERLVLRAAGRVIDAAHVTEAISRDVDASPRDAETPLDGKLAGMLEQIIRGKQSFWSVVYAPFVQHDLTRDELRHVVRVGLDQARGNYQRLTELFNMPPTDHRRLLTVLKRHGCHVRRGTTPIGAS